jgi:hypothetical protein
LQECNKNCILDCITNTLFFFKLWGHKTFIIQFIAVTGVQNKSFSTNIPNAAFVHRSLEAFTAGV